MDIDILTANSKFIKTKIFVYLKQAIEHNNAEFEIIYGEYESTNKITKLIFLKLLNYLKQSYECTESNSLDIRTKPKKINSRQQVSPLRCTIEGVSAIKKYCKTNSIDDIHHIHFIEKTYYSNPKIPDAKFNTIKNSDYNFRVNLKDETNVSELSSSVLDFKNDLSSSLKYYRYKKRFSFLTTDKLFRIDLTAVKSSESFYKRGQRGYRFATNLIDSGVLHNKETYELEIEYVGSDEYEGEYPIDAFVSKFYDSIDAPIQSPKPKPLTVASELSFVEPIKPYLYEDEISDDEYTYQSTSELLFPSVFSPITVELEDIHFDYWLTSDREWLYDEIVKNEKSFYYESLKKNDTDTYNDAPQNTDYVEFRIYPEFSYKEINENPDFPKDFTNIIKIPLQSITGSSESRKPKMIEHIEPVKKQLSWGPGKQKVKKQVKQEKKEIIVSETSPKWKPEMIGHFDPAPLIQFEDLKEAGAFDEDLEIQEKVWQKKMEKEREKSDKGRSGAIIIDQLIISLNIILQELFILIEGTELLVPKRKQQEIINNYKNLTEQSSKKTYFLGPQPVSLSLNELNPSNQHSILKGYVVTEKADGIRAELFIKQNECYLITQKLEVYDTGLLCENISGTWLFDGEYITKNKDGGDINLFMIFDVYYAGDGSGIYPNHAYTYPWLTMKRSKKEINRSTILNDFKTKVSFIPKSDSKDTMIIGYKTYHEGPKSLKPSKKDPSIYTNISKMGQVSKLPLTNDTKESGFGYRIDGLIYLPMFLSVNAMVEGESRKLGGQWNMNYKWKPPEENSIDFKVEIVQEKNKDKITTSQINGKSVKCKQLNLYIGYKYYEDKNFDYVWKIITNSYGKNPTEILFNPDLKNDKHITNIPLKNNTLLCERDKVEIKNGMILEMRYNPNNPIDSQWEPLRHRDDKLYPNKSTTAYSVWDTIQNPVTERFITGKDFEQIKHIQQEFSQKDESYYKDYADDIQSDIPLRQFHNYIKNKLITSICSLGDKSISIMDTSIGRGGDIKKYLASNNKIDFLFGLDISSDVTRKAAERYYNEHMRKPKAFFMRYDTSELIKGGLGYQGTDEEIKKNQIMMSLLTNPKSTAPQKYKEIKKEYGGLVSKGFDIISSQFTIHYYFENESKLRNYLQNLSDHCKPNGYFIGTCYDGMKVFELLKDEGNVTMYDEFVNKVYSITKDYEIDNFTYQKDDITAMLGHKIKVEMSSIGEEFTEYLVNFQFFVDIMKEYNFELVSPKFRGKFSGIFDTKDFSYKKGLGGFEQIIKRYANLSSKDTSIKKFFPESLELLKEENISLQQLSALNNWFIFQKKE